MSIIEQDTAEKREIFGKIIKRYSCEVSELQQLIKETLEHGDEGMGLSREFLESPHYFLQKIYEELSLDNKTNFQLALLNLLDKVVDNPKDFMEIEASDHLLFIVSSVIPHDSDASIHAAHSLKAIIANNETISLTTPISSEKNMSLHERATQTLFRLKTNETLSFWEELADKYGENYIKYALNSSFRSSLDLGVQWFIKHIDSQESQNSLIRTLPLLYKLYEDIEVDLVIAKIIRHTNDDYAQRLLNFQRIHKKQNSQKA